MGERKVLNKYYPPDFDPANIPKLILPKDRQYVVRLMAPFSMRCTTCGEYIYKGKKFNARKETVWDQEYLGIRIYRFYIRCTRCISEITFKTDPKNTDYVCENGAMRNFQAERLAIMAAEEDERLKENEEAENPMLALERRTKESKQEIDILDALEGIKDQNSRLEQVNVGQIIEGYTVVEKNGITLDEIEDEKLVSKYFGALKKETVTKLIEGNPKDGDVENDNMKKRKIESDLLPDEKRCFTEEFGLKSEEISKKTYKSKLQTFVTKRQTANLKPRISGTIKETPKSVNTNSKGLLKLDYSSGSESN
ncbi:hypothetical protein LOD99_5745 [Oopsacas minuta]|uniref:Splicing factor YJU2 n=1 Tax=Oopsacas minuta TaxID=111878 RepID=A0AAV7JR44_9METZ|nr:hypothetical protein LOD99_5745 [Oopsacas minuta]